MKTNTLTGIILSLSFFVFSNIEAQINSLYYGAEHLPQSRYINPAQKLSNRLHIGIPALSGININYENSAFSPLDLFEKGTDINSNLDKVIKELKQDDYLNFKSKIDILDIGFKTKIGYFSLGSYSESNFYMDYPIELLKLIRFDGTNYLGEDLSFNHLNIESSSFLANYIGYQTTFMDDKLSFGIRYKHLTGLFHGYTEKVDIGINRIDNHTLNLRSNSLAKISGLINLNDGEIGDNSGHALDLGLTYHLTDKISLGGSVIDLGSITWKGEQIHYSTSGEYNYTGIEVDLNSDDPFSDGSQRILDEIEDELNFRDDTVNDSYSRNLQTQYFLSGSYRLHKNHTFTALYSVKKAYENNLHNFSVNYYFKLSRGIQLMSAMSINESQTKFGGGAAVRMGYFQFYLMTDNIIKTIDYGRLRNVNLSFGMNIIVPEKKEKNNENYLDRKKRKQQEKLDKKKQKAEEKKEKETKNKVKEDNEKKVSNSKPLKKEKSISINKQEAATKVKR